MTPASVSEGKNATSTASPIIPRTVPAGALHEWKYVSQYMYTPAALIDGGHQKKLDGWL